MAWPLPISNSSSTFAAKLAAGRPTGVVRGASSSYQAVCAASASMASIAVVMMSQSGLFVRT